MDISRRSFVSGVANVACASALPTSSLPSLAAFGSSPLTVVNLVFHGSFAFILSNPIIAITPQNMNHSYCFLARAGYKRMSGSYTFNPKGVKPGTKPIPDPTSNLLLNSSNCGFDISKAGQNGTSQCSISLPYPKTMTPLRMFDNAVMSSQIYVYGKYAKYVKTTKFPLIQVFSYEVADASQIVLDAGTPANSWSPYLGAQTANLHIFAEPPTAVTPYHAQEAFSQLATLVHANLSDMMTRVWPDSPPPAPDTDTQVTDLWPEDEKTLEERAIPDPQVSAGIRVVNCMNMIIQ